MDKFVKALAMNNQIRVFLVNNTQTVNEAIKRHDLWPSAASVLGKVMAIGAMMGGLLKGDEALTIKVNGNGPIGNVIVDANGSLDVRGYVDHPHVHFSSQKSGLDDALTVGLDGYLDVIKDLKLKDLFTSTIALQSSLASTFNYYFMESEQTPTAISLGVLIDVDNTCKTSGGIILQVLPNATESTILALEKRVQSLNQFSQLLDTTSLIDILNLLFDQDYTLLEEKATRFFCSCSKESFARALLTLGWEELDKINREDHHIDTVCHYCNSTYHFDEEDIKKIMKELTHE